MNQPWICPSCKRGVAPGEKTCDHGGQLAYVPLWPNPVEPYPWRPTDPTLWVTTGGTMKQDGPGDTYIMN